MQIISCLIIDDDEVFAKNLTEIIEKLSFIKVIGHSKSYGEAIEALKLQTIDLIFLDVNLNDENKLNGFDLLCQYPKLPPVIIVSSSPEHAVESYSIGIAKDFLVKPFDMKRVLLAINRALDIAIDNGQVADKYNIFLKMGRKFKRFAIDEIDYIEGYGIYSKVVTNEGVFVINESLVSLESMLNTKKFMRVHKSYIINLNKLEGFDHNKLFLKSISIPIGISHKAKLGSLLRLFDNQTEVSTAE